VRQKNKIRRNEYDKEDEEIPVPCHK
jgi:hypothetical protein